MNINNLNPMQMFTNAARRIDSLFAGYFPESKHDHYRDFNYPQSITFAQYYAASKRNGLGKAAIVKTIMKTWETHPTIMEDVEVEANPYEEEVISHFTAIRFWQKLMEADRRALIGGWSGAILRLADGKQMDQPVLSVGGGEEGLVAVIPAWGEGQLTVAEWNSDINDENYGKPKMFLFQEAEIGSSPSAQGTNRSVSVHPDRVVIFSNDGEVGGDSLLEGGFNNLLDCEKISGAGGQGFWKNAKSTPVLELDKEAKIADMAKAMGVKPDEVVDKMNEQVDDWNKGFDSVLMLQGMAAKQIPVTLQSPQHFFNVSLQIFAASIPIPQKILVGNQNGERASSEDKDEWNMTNSSRRTNVVVPSIMDLVNRLVAWGILKDVDWKLKWEDLTESSMEEKIDRAGKMADVNSKSLDEPVFLASEIRQVVGFDELDESDLPDDNEEQDDDSPPKVEKEEDDA